MRTQILVLSVVLFTVGCGGSSKSNNPSVPISCEEGVADYYAASCSFESLGGIPVVEDEGNVTCLLIENAIIKSNDKYCLTDFNSLMTCFSTASTNGCGSCLQIFEAVISCTFQTVEN